MGVIYKTTNLINGKFYIGKRIFDPDRFMRSKYYGSGKLLKLAIKKYGLDNFDREILEVIDNDMLDDREKYWIKHYDSTNLEIGYNLIIGGNSVLVEKVKNSRKKRGKRYQSLSKNIIVKILIHSKAKVTLWKLKIK